MLRRLSGRVAFVTVGEGTGEVARARALGRALVAEGASVVLVSPDAGIGGRLAAELGAGAVFCSSDDVGADVDALVELAADLTRQA
ncbi:MAG: hypothetical protein V7605_2767 [Acidimicrobiaceae bacterium]|jgi:UDP:flavonoid glycosyltransferase YjiC (YdhE family)